MATGASLWGFLRCALCLSFCALLSALKCRGRPALRPAWLSPLRTWKGQTAVLRWQTLPVRGDAQRSQPVKASAATEFGDEVRVEFPLLQEMPEAVPFDNAATTHKPQSVIDVSVAGSPSQPRNTLSLLEPLSQSAVRRLQAEARVYRQLNANVHRGAYSLATAATNEMEKVREKVARFVGGRPEEVVFTSGATGALNAVARGFGDFNISEGDEILLSVAEHHANLVPWQQLCARRKSRLRFIPLCPDSRRLDFAAGVSCLTPKCKVISLALNSNVLGSHTDCPQTQRAERGSRQWSLKEFLRLAKQVQPDVFVVIDAAQAIAHRRIDVKEMQADALCCSGHKMYGSSGVGFLWGSPRLLSRMQPVTFGGEMVESVSLERSSFASPPRSLEAGTPPLAQIAGLGAAVDFLSRLGLERIEEEDSRLCRLLLEAVRDLPRSRLLSVDPWQSPAAAAESELKLQPGSRAREKDLMPPLDGSATACPIASFLVEGLSPFDIAFFADVDNQIHLRAGHHCAQPLHCEALGVSGSLRASLGVYNTSREIHESVLCRQAGQAYRETLRSLQGRLSSCVFSLRFHRGLVQTIRRLDSVAARNRPSKTIHLEKNPP